MTEGGREGGREEGMSVVSPSLHRGGKRRENAQEKEGGRARRTLRCFEGSNSATVSHISRTMAMARKVRGKVRRWAR